MREKHIILRTAVHDPRDPFAVSILASTRGAGGARIDVDEIEPSHAQELTRDADVVSVAPVIPIALIAPVSAVPPTEAIEDGITWGVRAVGAHESEFSGDGVVVAVLDTGIDENHPAFLGINLIERDFTGEGAADKNGHGTHCAGTIFGRQVNDTRIGVAPGVPKALIGKVLGTRGGSTETLVKGIQWAVENGAHIISMSLGMDFPKFVQQLVDAGYPPPLATSRGLEGYRANLQLFDRLAALIRAQAAFSQTSVIIAAAGNESRRDDNPDFRISVCPPAVSEGIISVGALQRAPKGLTVASFSNTGPTVSGPGVDIVSAKAGGGLTALSGTSMATAHVAGVAALWVEKVKTVGSLTALQLTGRLIGSGTNNGLQLGLDAFDLGAGLVRAPLS